MVVNVRYKNLLDGCETVARYSDRTQYRIGVEGNAEFLYERQPDGGLKFMGRIIRQWV